MKLLDVLRCIHLKGNGIETFLVIQNDYGFNVVSLNFGCIVFSDFKTISQLEDHLSKYFKIEIIGNYSS